MTHYLLEISYTPEAWRVMLKNPQDRAQAIEGAVKKLGGSVERFWMAFGKYDTLV